MHEEKKRKKEAKRTKVTESSFIRTLLSAFLEGHTEETESSRSNAGNFKFIESSTDGSRDGA